MKWFHVTVQFGSSAGKTQDLSPVLDLAGEWVQYTSGAWIITTNVDGRTLRDRIKAHVPPDSFIMVTKFDPPHTWGVLPMTVWDWLKRHGINFELT